MPISPPKFPLLTVLPNGATRLWEATKCVVSERVRDGNDKTMTTAMKHDQYTTAVGIGVMTMTTCRR